MIQVNFEIDAKLCDTITKASRDTTVGAFLACIENETIRQIGDLIPASGSATSELEKVRAALRDCGLQAAYAVVYGAMADPVHIITYTSDNAKAKERMLYSSGTRHLQDVVNRANTVRRTKVLSVQSAEVDDIEPALFQHKEDAAGRAALMTQSERDKAQIATMEVAPQPTVMPGVASPMDAAAKQLLHAFVENVAGPGGMVATFRIDSASNKTIADKHKIASPATDKNEQLALAVALLPADEPRYVLTDYCAPGVAKRAIVMVYVCPGPCGPRVKMPYASGWASFIQQLKDNSVDVAHRLETGSAAELPSAVADAFVPVDYGNSDGDQRARSGKPVGARGPRMLM